MEKTIVVRSLEWDEFVKFYEEIESKKPWPTADKDDVQGKAQDLIKLNSYHIKAAGWILDNIYPDLDRSQFTPGELMTLYFRTMAITNRTRDDELKNLIGCSTGLSTQTDKDTVKVAEPLKETSGTAEASV